ncbi:MAG TPA: AMP-binding protein, partial [Mycobacteriales bacterium]|nr:AMP-binding protein [Mycobacteriales bacterium]
KSARNSFVAAWLAGATAVVHAGRFDADERVAIAVEEKVSVWCMAPTEYRLLARRTALRGWPALRELVAAGEALDVATLETIRAATGLDVRDGYGQTETGQLTANPAGHPVRPGSMGRPLPGVRAWVADGELVVDPASVPTFFLGYRGEPPPRGPWHTGDLVHADADGYLYADGRADDVIISAGYRIGPTEVEQALAAHPAVAAVAVVPAPDEIRGSIVRAVVVLHDGWVGQAALTEELQAYVRATRAPHTYPRRIDYVADLPRTATGKVDRAALRDDGHPGRN